MSVLIAIRKDDQDAAFWDTVHAFADAAEPEFKKQLAAALSVLSDELTLDRVIQSQLAQDPDGIVRSLPWIEFQTEIHATTDILRRVLEQSGSASLAELVPAAQALNANFSVTNPLAVQFIAERGAQLVTAVTEETRLALRAATRKAYEFGGGGPREVARTLRGVVGLDQVQAKALMNFRAGLMDEVGRLTQKSQEKVDRYAKRLLKVRTERIARTELLTASNAGRHQSVEQAIQRGLLRRHQVVVRFLASGGERTCPICSSLNGRTIGYGESFSTTIDRPVAGPITYEAQYPPMHVQCRCTTVIDFVSGPVGAVHEQAASLEYQEGKPHLESEWQEGVKGLGVKERDLQSVLSAPPGFRYVVSDIDQQGSGFQGHRMEVSGSLQTKSGREVGTMTREFTRHDNGDLTVHHSLLWLRKGDQGEKVGAEIIRNQLARYEAMGVKEVTLSAANVGKYNWAKVGFEMSERSKATVATVLSQWQANPAVAPKWFSSVPKEEVSSMVDLFKSDPNAFARATYATKVKTTKVDSDEEMIAHWPKAALFELPGWSGSMVVGSSRYREALRVLRGGKK